MLHRPQKPETHPPKQEPPDLELPNQKLPSQRMRSAFRAHVVRVLGVAGLLTTGVLASATLLARVLAGAALLGRVARVAHAARLGAAGLVPRDPGLGIRLLGDVVLRAPLRGLARVVLGVVCGLSLVIAGQASDG